MTEKKSKKKFYITENYNVQDYAAKSYCSHVRNVLARIKLQFAKAIHEQILLPKVCIIVLDDDILRHTRVSEESCATILGKAVPWLLKEIVKLAEI